MKLCRHIELKRLGNRIFGLGDNLSGFEMEALKYVIASRVPCAMCLF